MFFPADNNLILLVLVLVIFAGVIAAILIGSKPISFNLKLRRHNKILSKAEIRMFNCLQSALSDKYLVFTKVAMFDVLRPKDGAGFFQSYRTTRVLRELCLDFVLCEKDSLSVVGIIHLGNADSKVDDKKEFKREKLITKFCKSTCLKLFFFDVNQNYRDIDIRRLIIGEHFNPDNKKILDSLDITKSTDAAYNLFAEQHRCPKCYAGVEIKVELNGESIGERFLLCRKYPYCNYRLAVEDDLVTKSVQKLLKQNAGNDVDDAFSDWSGD